MAGSLAGTTRLSPRGSGGPWGSAVGRERALGASTLMSEWQAAGSLGHPSRQECS